MNLNNTQPLILAILVAFLLLTMEVNAQHSERPNGFAGKILVLDHHTPSPEGLPSLEYWANGFEAAYFRNINNFMTVGVPFKLGVAKIPGSEFKNRIQVGSVDAVVRGRYLNGVNQRLVPYAFAGFGAVFEADQDMYTQVPLGLGVDIRLGPWGYLELQGEYRRTITDIERDNIQLGLGFLFMPGKNENKDEEPKVLDVIADNDADLDGIVDEKDDCPLLAGVAAFNGCPDTDGDGIGDKEDMCPDDKGPTELLGCPDSDGDGFSDIEDQCPDVPGTQMGCPDTDGDGIADPDDDCPTETGPLHGCPDTDGDGIADKDDKCPEEAGIPELGGCSDDKDTDGDGIKDKDDKCPNIVGVASNDGCPSVSSTTSTTTTYSNATDTDGDGVSDSIDACPNVYGSYSNSGCPEVRSEIRTVFNNAMQNVRFETASSKLKYESYPILDQIVDIMNSHPEHHIKISGHTDNIGDDAGNQRLSERRAKACLDYLKNKGISDLRLSFIGYGEAHPQDSNETSEGRRNNRRVEFALFLPRDSR